MQVKNTFHLSYCSNIHPGEDWEVTFNSLKENLLKIKSELVGDKLFGIGLRLSNKASEELNSGNNLEKFKQWLNQNNCYVFTMNGFPYGNFHGEIVKDSVHAPDWTTNERLVYTKRLFNQLAYIMPEGIDAGISTSPVSYKHWHESLPDVFEKGAQNMVAIALLLYKIEEETGKYLHLDIEPEPDGLLENTAEVIQLFQDYLIPIGKKAFEEIGVGESRAEALVKRYITVCYDVCHFSLAFEEPTFTFQEFEKHGINVGKIQISAALKIKSIGDNEAVWKALAKFNEPTYLHQVTELKNGNVNTYADLPVILEAKNGFEEMRAHFHVPIFLESFGLLNSTQDHIIKTFDYLKVNGKLTNHLEVETYTWDVLPEGLKAPLVDSVVRELSWVKENL